MKFALLMHLFHLQIRCQKCISYLTIEHKTDIERKYRTLIGNRIFGCDDCLSVCPWNKFAKTHTDIKLNINTNLVLQPLKSLVNLSEEKFRVQFAGSPIRRLGYNRFLRNILIAIGNSEDDTLIDCIIKKLDHKCSLVRSMAVWALSKLSKESFELEKNKTLQRKDGAVIKEWNEEF